MLVEYCDDILGGPQIVTATEAHYINNIKCGIKGLVIITINGNILFTSSVDLENAFELIKILRLKRFIDLGNFPVIVNPYELVEEIKTILNLK